MSVSGAHRAYKALVEAGLGAGGADNELHRLCGQGEEVVIGLCCLQ